MDSMCELVGVSNTLTYHSTTFTISSFSFSPLWPWHSYHSYFTGASNCSVLISNQTSLTVMIDDQQTLSCTMASSSKTSSSMAFPTMPSPRPLILALTILNPNLNLSSSSGGVCLDSMIDSVFRLDLMVSKTGLICS